MENNNKFWIEELNIQRMEKSFFSYMQKQRLKTTGTVIGLVFVLLISRLFYIQIIKHNEYSNKAVSQRMVTIPISTNRGEIYDRNLIPFTDREVRKVVIVYPAYLHDMDRAVDAVSRACNISVEDVKSRINNKIEAVEFIADDFSNEYMDLIESSRIKGVIAVEKKIRYGEDTIARHVVGYISKSEKIGQIGIEKSMGNFLAGTEADSIVAVVDSGKNIIPGLGFRKVEASKTGEGYNIKLTMDYYIQDIVEKTLKDSQINGAVVVMDIKSGDVLAMASSPDFDQNNIGQYLNSTGDELINKGIWKFDLGSIFKIIVAAAAIENKVIDLDEKFICDGYVSVGNYDVKCSTHKSHEGEEIDLKTAFALSCNTAFVKIGMKTGAEKILEMAKRLGLGEKQSQLLLEEKAGYLPNIEEDGIGNISIGQGKIQATPLQITNVMATIANGGIMHMPSIVEELVDNDGKTVKKLEKSKPKVVLSYRTIYMLKKLLAEVTKEGGTGINANIDEYGGSSGKTSSAETGINNGKVVHGWFAGYFPSNMPKYAVTVFVYNGKSGGKTAAPVFKKIATEMLDTYRR